MKIGWIQGTDETNWWVLLFIAIIFGAFLFAYIAAQLNRRP